MVSHMPYGPTAYFGLHNVVMRHDIQDRANVSEAYPHLVQHNLSTRVGKRVATILKHLFPVPKPDSRRVVSMVNQDDYIWDAGQLQEYLLQKNIVRILLMPPVVSAAALFPAAAAVSRRLA